jgi:hypothetical protein
MGCLPPDHPSLPALPSIGASQAFSSYQPYTFRPLVDPGASSAIWGGIFSSGVRSPVIGFRAVSVLTWWNRAY